MKVVTTMESYNKKVFDLLLHTSYLIYCVRKQGAVAIAREDYVTDVEPVVRSIMYDGLKFFSEGMMSERVSMLLRLKKVEYYKNSLLTVEDLKLIEIAVECIPYIQQADFEEFRGFCVSIFQYEAVTEQNHLFMETLSFLISLSEQEGVISKHELNDYVHKATIKTPKRELSREEIDQLLSGMTFPKE